MAQKIAFLGLGTMGAPMAGRLIAAGHDVTVWNRTDEKAVPLIDQGASAAASPSDAVGDADVVITMLSDSAAVAEVVSAFVPALKPNATLIDASTIGPAALAEVAALLPEGVTLVDSPVMGSADRAATGELVLLAGGEISAVRPILDLFGNVIHCGPLGNGAALKVVVIGAIVAGVTVIGEAMALADTFKLREELVVGVMQKMPLAGLAARAFAEGSLYQVKLAAKDVALGADVAHLPVARAVHQRLLDFPAAATEDIGQIVKFIRAGTG
jgi:3-hydroxyisobutyrate dehydrogenase-like beta-hydroxyacid dehydrogenase